MLVVLRFLTLMVDDEQIEQYEMKMDAKIEMLQRAGAGLAGNGGGGSNSQRRGSRRSLAEVEEETVTEEDEEEVSEEDVTEDVRVK